MSSVVSESRLNYNEIEFKPFPFMTFSVKLVKVTRPLSLHIERCSVFAPKYSAKDLNVYELIVQVFFDPRPSNKAYVTSTDSYVSLYVFVTPEYVSDEIRSRRE